MLASLTLAFCLRAAEPLPGRFAAVDIAPVKTSIYLGSVSLSSDRFVRRGGIYSAGYAARVFPYFFYNEGGQLQVEVSDDALRSLAGGSPIDFKGSATRSDGRRRAVEGRATPNDSSSGKLKVRVVVNRYITLIFNTTYQFPVPAIPSPR